jgi:micrococcal nuclease
MIVRSVVFGVILAVGISCNVPESTRLYTVTKVVDGDTFWVDDGSPKGLKVRLIGIDAPETQKSARKDVGYYGQEAKEYLTELILEKNVRVEFDVDRKDQYGRTLAYAYLEDGTFINAELLKLGYCMVLTVPPNVKFAQQFVDLQREAREHKRGLWAK